MAAKTNAEKDKTKFLYEGEVEDLQDKWDLFLKNDVALFIKKESSILGEVKTLGDEIRKDKKQVAQLNKYLKEKGIGFNSASTVYHKLLSLFFRNKGDNKRGDVSRYAKAILIADVHGVSGKDLTTWLSSKGGIQNVAYPKEKVEKAKEVKEQAVELGSEYFDLIDPIGKVSKQKNRDRQAGLVLLVGNIESDFSISILATHRSDPLLKTVLEQVGKKDESKKLVKQVNKQRALAQLETDFSSAVEQSAKNTKVTASKVTSKAKKQVNEE